MTPARYPLGDLLRCLVMKPPRLWASREAHIPQEVRNGLDWREHGAM